MTRRPALPPAYLFLVVPLVCTFVATAVMATYYLTVGAP